MRGGQVRAVCNMHRPHMRVAKRDGSRQHGVGCCALPLPKGSRTYVQRTAHFNMCKLRRA